MIFLVYMFIFAALELPVVLLLIHFICGDHEVDIMPLFKTVFGISIGFSILTAILAAALENGIYALLLASVLIALVGTFLFNLIISTDFKRSFFVSCGYVVSHIIIVTLWGLIFG